MHPDISILQFPSSAALALTFLVGVFLLWRFLPMGNIRHFLSGKCLCCISLAAVILMTAAEGTWVVALHRSWYFWVPVLLMMLSLEFTVLDGFSSVLRLYRRGGTNASAPAVPGLLCHLGFFLLASGAFWGAPDFVDVQIAAGTGISENQAYTREGRTFSLPFNLRLEEFVTDYYDDGISPKQYSSLIDVDGTSLVTSVTHPARYKGYRIYQNDFDRVEGSFSVLKLVRDPWLPLVWLGMILMALGAALGLRADWKSKYLTVALIIAALLFTIISVARINFGTLVPALRSWWFVPHLVLYMLAYSALALALVFSVISTFVAGESASSSVEPSRFRTLSIKLFDTASSLLLLGMLCGGVWAKAAWGDWWTWDAKECWAGVTWMLTILGTHLPFAKSRTLSGLPERHRNIAIFICMLLAFLAMQMAWYGIDWLPASHASLHTYR